MKRIILILLAAIVAAALPLQARTYALLAAVSDYGNPEHNLPNATPGAKAFRDILRTQTKDITLLTTKHATAKNILEKLRAITNRAQAGDRIIFFFNGHGFQGGVACFGDTYLHYTDLVKALTDTKASEVFVFIDACHSGSVGDDVSDKSNWFEGLKPGDGHVYMLSSRGEEASYGSNWLNKCYFTQALLTGYRGKSDTNHDRDITVLELFKHIHKDVVRRSDDQQHPIMLAPKSMHDAVLIRYNEQPTD